MRSTASAGSAHGRSLKRCPALRRLILAHDALGSRRRRLAMAVSCDADAGARRRRGNRRRRRVARCLSPRDADARKRGIGSVPVRTRLASVLSRGCGDYPLLQRRGRLGERCDATADATHRRTGALAIRAAACVRRIWRSTTCSPDGSGTATPRERVRRHCERRSPPIARAVTSSSTRRRAPTSSRSSRSRTKPMRSIAARHGDHEHRLPDAAAGRGLFLYDAHCRRRRSTDRSFPLRAR